MLTRHPHNFGLIDHGIRNVFVFVENGRSNVDGVNGLLEAVRNDDVDLLGLLLDLLEGAQFGLAGKLGF